MPKYDAAARSTSAFDPDIPSLFDPENLQELDHLRQRLSVPATVRMAEIRPPCGANSNVPTAEHMFKRFQIDDAIKDWQVGVVDVDIIHCGRIRIRSSEWPAAIKYCRTDVTENGVAKQFGLHVLRHSSDVSLVYGTYRFKQQISKSWIKDYRWGKLLDPTMNVRETMVNLAYWLTAHEHAEKNYTTWETLIEEALTKLSATDAPTRETTPTD